MNHPRPAMNAMAIAMVRNEADVIEAFARHALHFVDLLVVIDNRSTDGTRDILQALRREGLRILLVDDPVCGHFQSEKVTYIYRKVVPLYQPELVYLLDADEFLHVPDRATLETALAGLAPGSIGLLPWQTYVPAPGQDPAALRLDPLGAMARRRRHENPQYYKAVIRRLAADDTQLVIDQGNHGVRRSDGRAVPATLVEGAAIAHLPVRSAEQLTAKVVNGWHACILRNRHHNVPGEAYQWRELYDRIVQGRPLDDATLAEVALGYAQRPQAPGAPAAEIVSDPVVARYGPLRHLALGRHSAMAKVALSLEGYLQAQAVVVGSAHEPAEIDLAPVADLVDLWQARRIASTPAGRPWLAELQARDAAIQPAVDANADLLLAPRLPLTDSLALAAAFAGGATVPVILWPDRPRRGSELRAELEAWATAGYGPDLLLTLGLRALASFAALRHGAFVLRPLDAASHQRAQAVRELFLQLAAAPHAWTDPQPQHVGHALQPLGLAAV